MGVAVDLLLLLVVFILLLLILKPRETKPDSFFGSVCVDIPLCLGRGRRWQKVNLSLIMHSGRGMWRIVIDRCIWPGIVAIAWISRHSCQVSLVVGWISSGRVFYIFKRNFSSITRSVDRSSRIEIMLMLWVCGGSCVACLSRVTLCQYLIGVSIGNIGVLVSLVALDGRVFMDARAQPLVRVWGVVVGIIVVIIALGANLACISGIAKIIVSFCWVLTSKNIVTFVPIRFVPPMMGLCIQM